MKKHWPKPYDRPKQETPAEIMNDLLLVIRNQLCPGLSPKEWYQSQNFFKRVLTYPAAWLNTRGVTLPPDRYHAIVRKLILDIKVHSAADSVQYWPGYLLKCFQEHFRHHGEDYYDEGKSFRNLTERALFATRRAQEARTGVDPVEVYAKANAVLAARKRRPGARPAKGPKQEDLFSL